MRHRSVSPLRVICMRASWKCAALRARSTGRSQRFASATSLGALGSISRCDGRILVRSFSLSLCGTGLRPGRPTTARGDYLPHDGHYYKGMGWTFCPARQEGVLRKSVVILSLLGGAVITAQQQPAAPNPRQQPGAMVHIFAPEQHDLYDGHFVISANRIYMVGGLNDPEGWDHLDNEAENVKPVSGTAEIDVNEIQNSGKFEARLKIPEGDLVLAMDKWHEFNPCQNGGIVAYIHEHGTDSGCGDNNWPKTVGFLAGWGFGHATLNGKPLYQDYEMHFMVTQGLRDRKTLRVNYPLATRKLPGGETNPATQQIDFYIRSPQMNPKNRPARQVFMHFFGMEITWK